MDSSGNENELEIENRPRSSLKQFVAKAAAVGIIAILASWAISGIFADAIGNVLDERISVIESRINARLSGTSVLQANGYGGTGILKFLETQLARIADSNVDLHPQRKQKIIADLRTVSDRWRPFFIEASSAVIDSPSSSTTKRE